MVKGTSKRVIVVKSPDPKIFEQAIFIVKEDLRNREGGDVLREAQRVADEYIRGALAAPVKPRLHLPRWGWVLLSAAVLGFGGFAAHWLGLW